jgi:hypothetical protein
VPVSRNDPDNAIAPMVWLEGVLPYDTKIGLVAQGWLPRVRTGDADPVVYVRHTRMSGYANDGESASRRGDAVFDGRAADIGPEPDPRRKTPPQ